MDSLVVLLTQPGITGVCRHLSFFLLYFCYHNQNASNSKFYPSCFFLCEPNQKNSWKKSSLRERQSLRLQGPCFSASPLTSESSTLTPKAQELLLTSVCFHLAASPRIDYVMGWLLPTIIVPLYDAFCVPCVECCRHFLQAQKNNRHIAFPVLYKLDWQKTIHIIYILNVDKISII